MMNLPTARRRRYMVKTIANLTKNVNQPDKKCQAKRDFFVFLWLFQPFFELARRLL
jgi:hypothetical protein